MSAQFFDREDCTVEPGIEIEARLMQLIRLVDMLEAQVGTEALGMARCSRLWFFCAHVLR